MSKESLQKAVTLAGGQVHLARRIRALLPDTKIGQVHIWGWLNNAKMEVPPAEVVITISEVVGWQVTPHELRADIYPDPHDGLPSIKAIAVRPSDDRGRRVIEDRRALDPGKEVA